MKDLILSLVFSVFLGLLISSYCTNTNDVTIKRSPMFLLDQIKTSDTISEGDSLKIKLPYANHNGDLVYFQGSNTTLAFGNDTLFWYPNLNHLGSNQFLIYAINSKGNKDSVLLSIFVKPRYDSSFSPLVIGNSWKYLATESTRYNTDSTIRKIFVSSGNDSVWFLSIEDSSFDSVAHVQIFQDTCYRNGDSILSPHLSKYFKYFRLHYSICKHFSFNNSDYLSYTYEYEFPSTGRAVFVKNVGLVTSIEEHHTGSAYYKNTIELLGYNNAGNNIKTVF